MAVRTDNAVAGRPGDLLRMTGTDHNAVYPKESQGSDEPPCWRERLRHCRVSARDTPAARRIARSDRGGRGGVGEAFGAQTASARIELASGKRGKRAAPALERFGVAAAIERPATARAARVFDVGGRGG